MKYFLNISTSIDTFELLNFSRTWKRGVRIALGDVRRSTTEQNNKKLSSNKASGENADIVNITQ